MHKMIPALDPNAPGARRVRARVAGLSTSWFSPYSWSLGAGCRDLKDSLERSPPGRGVPWCSWRPSLRSGQTTSISRCSGVVAAGGEASLASQRPGESARGCLDWRFCKPHFLNCGDVSSKLKHNFIYSFINTVVFTSII